MKNVGGKYVFLSTLPKFNRFPLFLMFVHALVPRSSFLSNNLFLLLFHTLLPSFLSTPCTPSPFSSDLLKRIVLGRIWKNQLLSSSLE